MPELLWVASLPFTLVMPKARSKLQYDDQGKLIAMNNEYVEVCIPIECELTDRLLVELIKVHQSDFSEVTSGLCKRLDSRAEYVDDSLRVESVSLDGDKEGGTVDVQFSAYIYHGCKDIDGTSEIEESWDFEVIDDCLVFNILKPLLIDDREDEI